MNINNIPEPNHDSKNVASLIWIGMIVFFFWVPLGVYLIKTDDDFVREHAKMSLNWSLTMLVLSLIGAALALMVVGKFILGAIWLLNLIFGILGAIAACKGEYYHCPMAVKLLK